MGSDVPRSADEVTSAMLQGSTLALFFTYKTSLQRWEETGLIEREAAVYNLLSQSFDEIVVFTYGGESDLDCQHYFNENVRIVPNTTRFGSFTYSLLLPILHRETFKAVDVVKTNQMKGSWTAVLAKFLHRIPLVVRTGYILSRFSAKQDRPRWKRYLFTLLEFISYKSADAIFSPSQHGFDYVEERYAPGATHRIVHNYVDTEQFRPLPDVEPNGDVCIVCRIAEQKNLFALVDAIDPLDVSLTIVGTGPLEDELQSYCETNGIDVTFEGQVPHSDIPAILTAHRIFALPSKYEGMPKALLEAMSCGLAVVGTDVKGIREVIESGTNGRLCEPTPESIRLAISDLAADETLRNDLGRNARQTILEEFSLSATTTIEMEVYEAILDE